MSHSKRLLVVIELGGYPDFSPLYERLGYEVTVVNSVRKAIREIKQQAPDVIVSEFNFQSDFRDRTSSLESLMSTAQWHDGVKVIVFFEKEYQHQLDRLTAQYEIEACLAFPIDEQLLSETINCFT